MIGDDLFDASGKLLHFLAWGVEGDLDEKALATHHPKAKVFDRRIADRSGP
jgi:hypothetical protein